MEERDEKIIKLHRKLQKSTNCVNLFFYIFTFQHLLPHSLSHAMLEIEINIWLISVFTFAFPLHSGSHIRLKFQSILFLSALNERKLCTSCNDMI